MTIPQFIGLAGVAGAGKDTVFDRLKVLGGDKFVRLSVADPLKESVAALFGISLDDLEELKRDPHAFVRLGGADPRAPHMSLLRSLLSVREFLQRYGTESHRGVFGDDFWLDVWEERADKIRFGSDAEVTIVNTSVRFENEAQRILDLGGAIWQVNGPQDDGAGGHESESPLPYDLITEHIDNTVRQVYEETAQGGFGMPNVSVQGGPDFSHLDDQIATLLHGGTLA